MPSQLISPRMHGAAPGVGVTFGVAVAVLVEVDVDVGVEVDMGAGVLVVVLVAVAVLVLVAVLVGVGMATSSRVRASMSSGSAPLHQAAQAARPGRRTRCAGGQRRGRTGGLAFRHGQPPPPTGGSPWDWSLAQINVTTAR